MASKMASGFTICAWFRTWNVTAILNTYGMHYDKSNIIAALHSAGVPFKDKGRQIVMECIFHPERVGKPDRSKDSLDMFYDGSKAQCWSCGWSGSWRSIAPAIGIDPGKPVYDTAGIVHSFREMRGRRQHDKDNVGISDVPADVEPWEGCWRKLDSTFLEPIAYAWYDSHSRVDRILFPDYQHDGTIWVAGAEHDHDRKRLRAKWRNADGKWAGQRFFGEQAMRDHSRVALVEGPYDALRLRYHGIPTLAILGTQNWNEKKAKRLAILGVEEIVLMMDGDKAGRKCNKHIRDTGAHYFYSWSIKIPWGKDPGNIHLRLIHAIRRKLSKRGWFD